MKRKLIFVTIILLVIAGYFMWFRKDKTLKFVPKNADIVVLIDVKKASQQYIFNWAKHPNLWLGDSKISFKNNGIELPDFVQIFHLKNTNFTEWYSIFELSDKAIFLEFLNEKGFRSIKNNIYKKDQFSIKIEGQKCIIGFSDQAFENTAKTILNLNEYKTLEADQLIINTIGSISCLSKSQIRNFPIDLNDDNIEIKNDSQQNSFSSLLSVLEKKTSFLKLQLDSENIQKTSILFNKKLSDSIDLKSISAGTELEMVNDKIISYAYDDNFNEIEKVSYQKIVQPNYTINLHSFDAQKTWLYLENKKWINAQNQFTLIPFQPNLIGKNGNNILIKSTKKSIPLQKSTDENYIFIRNSSLLSNSVKSFSKNEKKVISNIDFLFYGNQAENYYLKLKFKTEQLPIILRWVN